MRLPPSINPKGYLALVGDIDPKVVERIKEQWLRQLPIMRMWMAPIIKVKPSYNHQLKKLIKGRS